MPAFLSEYCVNEKLLFIVLESCDACYSNLIKVFEIMVLYLFLQCVDPYGSEYQEICTVSCL